MYNPADDSLVTDQVQVASSQDVDNAVAAATTAFETWSKTPSSERAAIMLKYADLLDKNTTRLAELETLAIGAPKFLANSLAQTQATSFRYYAGLIDKIHGETYSEDGDGLFKMIVHEPIGVCAGISAWNGTPLSVGWKVSRATCGAWLS